MKPRKTVRRQIFVLTPEEKRVVACIVGAFLLGLGTMHYRATHPRTPTPPTGKELRAKKTSATKAKSPTPRASSPRATATPMPRDLDEE